MLVLGGRAPAMRWGQGSLQEIDHVPFVRPLAKLAATAGADGRDPGADRRGLGASRGATIRARLRRPPARRRVHGGRGAAAARDRAAGRGRHADGGGGRARGRAAARGRPPGDHGRHQPLLGPRRGTRCASWPRRAGSPSSSTASRAAACPPTTSASSHARAAPRSRAPTSRSSSACRWTSGSASAARSATRPRSSRSTSPSPSATTRARSRPSSTATSPPTLGALARRGADTAAWLEHLRGGRAPSARPSASS